MTDLTERRLTHNPELVLDVTLCAVRLPDRKWKWRLEVDCPNGIEKRMLGEALCQCGSKLLFESEDDG